MGAVCARRVAGAGLDADGELETVLEEIIASPAMSRAPLQFWESVKPHVQRIVARNPQFGLWLLVHTTPQARHTGDSTVWPWLDLLDAWNVLPWLSADGLPADPEIPGGRAGWIGRLARVESSPNKRVFELLEQMADVLRREGQPVPLFEKPRWGRLSVDVDVLEACLDLDLPLNDVPEQLELNFDGWLRAGDRAEQIGRILGVPPSKVVRVLLPIGVPAEAGPRAEKKPFGERAWFSGYGGQ